MRHHHHRQILGIAAGRQASRTPRSPVRRPGLPGHHFHWPDIRGLNVGILVADRVGAVFRDVDDPIGAGIVGPLEVNITMRLKPGPHRLEARALIRGRRPGRPSPWPRRWGSNMVILGHRRRRCSRSKAGWRDRRMWPPHDRVVGDRHGRAARQRDFLIDRRRWPPRCGLESCPACARAGQAHAVGGIVARASTLERRRAAEDLPIEAGLVIGCMRDNTVAHRVPTSQSRQLVIAVARPRESRPCPGRPDRGRDSRDPVGDRRRWCPRHR